MQSPNSADFRSRPQGLLFESYEDFVNDPPVKWVIERLFQAQEINLIAGLSGDGKTWTMLAIAKALLEGLPLFGEFQVPEPAARVIYLIPEVGRRPFFKRLKLMKLDPFLQEQRLLVRTLSRGLAPKLCDPRLLDAAAGADVFLDTIVRFEQGEENSSSDNRALADGMFQLLQAGARSVTGAHHSPKSFQQQNEMTLEGVLRGNSDIGAMASNVYGIRQLVEQTNLIHIECVKGRDLDETVQPFQIEGRPWIEQEGNFRIVQKPCECESLREEMARIARNGGAKKEYAKTLWSEGKGRNEIARLVKEKFDKCSPHTVTDWIQDWVKSSGQRGSGGALRGSVGVV